MEKENPSSSPQKPANLEDFEREPLVQVPPNVDLGQEQVRREAEANSTAYGPPYPLHIRLSEDLSHPDTNLRKHIPILLKIFPGTTEVSDCFIHLHFSVKKLPPRPWPLTIGGKPFTITDEQGKGKLFIFPLSGKGNTAFHLRPDIDRSFGSMESGSFAEFAETIHCEMVDRFPDLNVAEYIVDTSNGALRIVLADDVNPAQFNGRLPGRIANRWGFYIFERDLRRVESAHREISPDADRDIVDTTCYDTLRPGVLVHSKASSDRDNTATLSSSTGVMVRDKRGNEFMTGASHRIGPDNVVFQKLPGGETRRVGYAEAHLSFIDVALISLDADRRFVNETFHVENQDAMNPNRLLGETGDDDKLRVGDMVYLSTAMTKHLKGMTIAVGWKPRPLHVSDWPEEINGIVYNWWWYGQEALEIAAQTETVIPDGACGCPMVDDQGRVTGFFRWVIEDGEYAGLWGSTSAQHLVDAGFGLASPGT